MSSNHKNSSYWRKKLNAYLHDSPDKATDIPDHERRADMLKRLDQFKSDEFFDKNADWLASASDRLPFPDWRKLRQPFSELKTYPHPMGEASLPVGAGFKSSTEAFGTSQKSRPFLLGNDDPRASFICAWRFWRNWASSIDPRFSHLPADTRIPDHTIWHHLNTTSAFEGSLPTAEQKKDYPDQTLRPRLLLFSIGPVQDFIASARSTRDLWSGSYLLSYLVSTALGKIALEVGPDHVVFPNLLDQPLIDAQLKGTIYDQFNFSGEVVSEGFDYSGANLSKLLTPSLPNRFMVLLPARLPDGQTCDEYAAQLVEDIKDELTTLAEDIVRHLEKHPHQAITLNTDLIEQQKERLLEAQWFSLPIPNSAEELERLSEQLPQDDSDLEFTPRKAYKAIKDMIGKSECKPQYPVEPPTYWGLLNALTTWLHDGSKSLRSFEAWREGRWASGRQYNKDHLNGKEEAVLTVAQISKDEAKTYSKSLGMSKNTLKPGELLSLSTLIKRFWHHTSLHDILDIPKEKIRSFPMPNTHSMALGKPQRDDDTDGSDEKDSEGKYYAILALDGDQMGKWISGSKSPTMNHCLSPNAREFYKTHAGGFLETPRSITPSWHSQFAEALGNFSFHCAQRIIEAFDGRLIYAGGDDVLAMLPAKDALPCARALRAAFRGEKELNTLAKGKLQGTGAKAKSDRTTTIFNIQHDGYLQLHEDSGASYGSEANLLSDPVEFPTLLPGPATDVSIGIAIAHFKSPLQDVVKAAQTAEKRAKRNPEDGGLGRAAVATTIYKRSGEILKWGYSWGSEGEALIKLIVDLLNNEKLNRRFPHKLEALLIPYLPATDSIKTSTDFENGFAGILALELTHCINRNEGGKLNKDEMEQLAKSFALYWDELSSSESNDPNNINFTEKLTRCINLLRTAAWISTKKGKPAKTTATQTA